MASLDDSALARCPDRASTGCCKLDWLVRRPRTFGAHALALTPDGKVDPRQAPLRAGLAPAGRRPREDEDPRDAVLRELREEIGMTAHGAVRFGARAREAADFKRDLASLLVVEDVRYRPPRWSWEIERIMEAPLDDLPADLSPRTAAGWRPFARGPDTKAPGRPVRPGSQNRL